MFCTESGDILIITVILYTALMENATHITKKTAIEIY